MKQIHSSVVKFALAALMICMLGTSVLAAHDARASENAAVETASIPYGWFAVQAQVWVSPRQATVAVQNFWAYPILCQGQLWAQSYYGGAGWLNVLIGPVIPGTYGYAYLYPVYGDAFVSGNASLYCRWY